MSETLFFKEKLESPCYLGEIFRTERAVRKHSPLSHAPASTGGAEFAFQHGSENFFPALLLARDRLPGIKPLLQAEARSRLAEAQNPGAIRQLEKQHFDLTFHGLTVASKPEIRQHLNGPAMTKPPRSCRSWKEAKSSTEQIMHRLDPCAYSFCLSALRAFEIRSAVAPIILDRKSQLRSHQSIETAPPPPKSIVHATEHEGKDGNDRFGRVKLFRRVSIFLMAAGVFLLSTGRESPFETVPFPAAGLTVKMIANVKTDGDYCFEALMPKPDQDNALGGEKVPCSLTVILTREGKPSITNQITSLSLTSEYGFARIQYFEATPWHLRPGEYELEITSRGNCQAALSRGAALSLEKKETGITESFLRGVLRYWSGVLFLCAGLLGVILCEFKKTYTQGFSS